MLCLRRSTFAALLRALVMHSAVPLAGRGCGDAEAAEAVATPDDSQGFGRVEALGATSMQSEPGGGDEAAEDQDHDASA